MPSLSFRPEHEKLAMRPLSPLDSEWMLRATLSASDHGILVSGLGGEIIAVNRRFGDLFGVDPDEALTWNIDSLRAKISPHLRNSDAWLNSSETAVGAALEEEVVIELYRGARTIFKQFSAPICHADGTDLGRLWSFRDVTREHRLQEMYRQLHEVSESSDPTPETTIRRILEVISVKYDRTTAILSMLRGDRMDFRTVVGPNIILNLASGNSVKDSFCQFALSSERPIIIQNGRKEPAYCQVRATKLGLTRYMGVPILDDDARPIGTLCLMDGKSEQLLDDLDLQFLSLIAVRVSAELSRERHVQESMAVKQTQIEMQRADLAATNSVFDAMNRAFALLGSVVETDQLLREQTRLLTGLLGYSSAAVLIRRRNELRFQGFTFTSGRQKGTPICLEIHEIPKVPVTAVGTQEGATNGISERMRASFLAYAIRTEDEVGEILIALGRTGTPAVDERHLTHLEAITDQVCLLLSTHVLQSALVVTNYELAGTQEQLLQNEKLSVVGTLAASTAHDIRNITASLGLLAAPSSIAPEVTLKSIREQLGRFDVLAHRLLSYAKPRLMAQEEVDLVSVLDAVVTLTAAQARVSKVDVRVKLTGPPPKLIGDPHQFEHLFVNLILNGIQSMHREGGSLTVDLKADRERIRIKIIDSGPGIPKEVQGRLFEPFASSRPDGFGLGLYSCRRIAEAHHGTISAKRNPIKGSTFTLEFPLTSSH